MGAITEAFRNEYNDVLLHLVENKGNRLLKTVLFDPEFSGEAKYYDQLGQTAVITRTSRNQATPIIDALWDKRKLTAVDYIHNFVVDKGDSLSMAINPNTGLVKSQGRAFSRATDKVIYDSLLGTAYSGKAGTTSNTISNTVTCTGGLTIAKLLEIKETLDLEDVDDPEEDERFLVLTAYEITDLLNTTEIKSSDYDTVKALAAGTVNSFCGFNFIRLSPTSKTNGILTRASNVNYCVAYVKSGLMFGAKKGLESRVDERKDLNYSTQFWAEKIMGAVRLEEEKVVAVNVTNT